MCFSVILLPGPATFTLLPGEKYLISFCYKSCFNFVLEVSSDCASANLGMGGERKEEKRSRYECVRKKLPKKGNGQSIPPAPMLQSCVNIVRLQKGQYISLLCLAFYLTGTLSKHKNTFVSMIYP